jgi:predicted alpha-1,2-mannosidase
MSYGNTYPMTAMPFAMHGWSAQTGPNGEGWKYQYFADKIRGFQQVHQCSPWVSDYAVYSVMPVVGQLVLDHEARAARFSHENEIARPNYYKVGFDNGVTTELAPTERGVHMRFSYPKGEDAWLVLDGYTDMSSVKIDPAGREISGWVNNQRFVNHSENFRSWFVMKFDTAFEEWGVWENREGKRFPGETSGEGKGYGIYVKFKRGAKVQARAASSYIDREQALVTLDRELGRDKTLEATKKRGAETWNRLLGRIEVEGGTEEQMRTFYSCLFRANLYSRMFYEIDAKGEPRYYSPYDGKVYAGYMYTDNGLWDTFRSQFPLTNILHPTMQGRYMNALLDAQQQCGWLPSWSFPGETGGMVGNHSISLLTDAWVKGIRTFDPQRALAAYAHEAMNKGPWGGANGRAGWKDYWQLGYVAYPGSLGSTAQTLEYAYDDFCAYTLAKMTGNKFYEEIFARQMYNYRNVFDKRTGFMRGRLVDGSWLEPFDPWEWGGPYCEGNAWHYNWSVFHDVQGLIDLYGSDEAFTAKIDSVFTISNRIVPGTYGGVIHEMKEMELAGMGQYAHGNQPIQHMIYMYSYAGQPWKTQYWARRIMSRLYNSSERGFPGDEDQGGMSSWYVLSALGIYSVCPGSDEYVLGSPVFPKATITFEDGKKFVIEAAGNCDENVYIQSATLNGRSLDRNYVTYGEMAGGGTMRFEMGANPEKSRGTSKSAAPFSLSNDAPRTDWAWTDFKRPEGVNPVISPDADSRFYCPLTGAEVAWESGDTFNPAATVYDGKVVVLYRAEDRSGEGIGQRTSRLGYASSENGLDFTRLSEPVFYPAADAQKELEWPGGVEDPRVAMTGDGTYVMFYTQWNRRLPRLAVATSRDLKNWTKHGPAFAKAHGGKFANEFGKSASIVTKVENGRQVIAKIDGRYWLYWGEKFVNVATSYNLVDWTPMLAPGGGLLKLIEPREGMFDSELTECGPPAVVTSDGILLIYNGKGASGSYCAGQVLFDGKEPTRLLARLDKPFFVPEADFEKSGQYAAGTVFTEGLVWHNAKWFLYYGCADSRVAVAVYDPAAKR